MQGNGSIDRALTASADKAMGDEAKAYKRRINMLGIVTAATKFHGGAVPDPSCPWCGAAKESWEHLWWVCPAFEDIRVARWGHARPNHELLPPLLRHAGVAPGVHFVQGGPSGAP